MSRELDALGLYERVATRSSAAVISGYSTSFTLASRLYSRRVRADVANVYALVRVADEIVDGTAAAAGLDAGRARAALDALERETEHALRDGFSANLVVHAFAATARRSGFGAELTEPFFASMRTDLDTTRHTEQEVERYVFGSAEVVGLMCLRVFLTGADVPAGAQARLESGARSLGAAFQKVNFLRDLGEDYRDRGRSYLPGADPAALSEADKHRLLDDIDADLRQARSVLGDLPADSRRAVAAALGLFAELAGRLRQVPASDLLDRRVSVPTVVKLRILLRAALSRPARTGGRSSGTAR